MDDSRSLADILAHMDEMKQTLIELLAQYEKDDDTLKEKSRRLKKNEAEICWRNIWA